MIEVSKGVGLSVEPEHRIDHVAEDLVEAALRASRTLRRPVAEVAVSVIAAEVGMSRSTVLRRLGGTRMALDEAVRARGVDPGGEPVRERALVAGAELIQEVGLGGTTLDAVADRAGCSTDALRVSFGSRDEFLAAVFGRYSPLLDVDDLAAADGADLGTTVRRVYRRLSEALTREPRVAPAIIAEVLARPTAPIARAVVERNAPQIMGVVGGWLASEVRAGRIRTLPLPLLLHLFIAPILMHTSIRPALTGSPASDLPDLEQAGEVFAAAFVRAVATAPPPLG